MPSLFRSVVRGEDWDPITGKSLFQITLLCSFEWSLRTSGKNYNNNDAINCSRKQNLISTKEVLRNHKMSCALRAP